MVQCSSVQYINRSEAEGNSTSIMFEQLSYEEMKLLARNPERERDFFARHRDRGEDLASAVRIFVEILRGYEALELDRPSVTVFGSARFTEDNRYYQWARSLGSRLAQEEFAVITGGGPGNTTTLTSIDLKREAFEKWRTGYASAYAVILFVTVFGLASIYVKALNKVKER